MPGLTHGIWIDESGNGKIDAAGVPVLGIQSLWVSAGVGIEWSKVNLLTTGVKAILRDRFLNRCRELKASQIRRYLPSQFSAADIAQDVARLMHEVEGHVWLTGTRAGSKPMLSHPKGRAAHPKEVARQLLLERISGYTTPRFFADGSWIAIWDVDDAGSLGEFSSSVAAFRNRVSGYSLPTTIVPSMLGGLSHEWSPLQIADVYANFALHRVGVDLNLPDAKVERAEAFTTFLEPSLKRDNSGKVVGWKIW